jgi:holliday junction DNA helicase RuvA
LIAHIAGELRRVEADYVVVDVGGVGYKVFAPMPVITSLPSLGSKVSLYTYTNVKDDSITLYGFSELDQQDVFELLLTVSGVGPRLGLNILSVLPVEHLVDAIVRDNHVVLTRIPGVGTKTAQRIVLELKEKITALSWAQRARDTGRTGEQKILDDIVEGLVGLGYTKNDARRAAEEALKSSEGGSDTASVMRRALKIMTGG